MARWSRRNRTRLCTRELYACYFIIQTVHYSLVEHTGCSVVLIRTWSKIGMGRKSQISDGGKEWYSRYSICIDIDHFFLLISFFYYTHLQTSHLLLAHFAALQGIGIENIDTIDTFFTRIRYLIFSTLPIMYHEYSSCCWRRTFLPWKHLKLFPTIRTKWIDSHQRLIFLSIFAWKISAVNHSTKIIFLLCYSLPYIVKFHRLDLIRRICSTIRTKYWCLDPSVIK